MPFDGKENAGGLRGFIRIYTRIGSTKPPITRCLAISNACSLGARLNPLATPSHCRCSLQVEESKSHPLELTPGRIFPKDKMHPPDF